MKEKSINNEDAELTSGPQKIDYDKLVDIFYVVFTEENAYLITHIKGSQIDVWRELSEICM